MKIQENPLYFFYLNSMCKFKLLNRICKRYYSRSTQYYNEIEKKTVDCCFWKLQFVLNKKRLYTIISSTRKLQKLLLFVIWFFIVIAVHHEQVQAKTITITQPTFVYGYWQGNGWRQLQQLYRGF